MIRWLANENFPYTSINILRNAGFDVLSIGENHSGIKDSEVMNIAIHENRTILTFDRNYGELVFKHGFRPAHGIIYFRWESFTPEEPGLYLLDLVNQDTIKLMGSLTVIDSDVIRQRIYI